MIETEKKNEVSSLRICILLVYELKHKEEKKDIDYDNLFWYSRLR